MLWRNGPATPPGRFLAVFLLAALPLGGLLWFELTRPMPTTRGLAGRAAAPARTMALIVPSTDQVAAWQHVIIGRPLFSPSRHPPPQASGQAAKNDHGLPRLSGVIVAPGGTAAIFAEPGHKPLLAKEGDRIGPYVVRSIIAGKVVISGPHGDIVLRPEFAGQASPEPPVSSAAALSALPPPPPAPTPTQPAVSAKVPSQSFIQGVLAEQRRTLDRQNSRK